MLLIMSYWKKLFSMLGKLQRAHPTLRGHFASAYLIGSYMLRAYLFFIYGFTSIIISISDMLWKSSIRSFWVRALLLFSIIQSKKNSFPRYLKLHFYWFTFFSLRLPLNFENLHFLHLKMSFWKLFLII